MKVAGWRAHGVVVAARNGGTSKLGPESRLTSMSPAPYVARSLTKAMSVGLAAIS